LFLAINRFDLVVDQAEAVRCILALASSEISEKELSHRVRENAEPRDEAEHHGG